MGAQTAVGLRVRRLQAPQGLGCCEITVPAWPRAELPNPQIRQNYLHIMKTDVVPIFTSTPIPSM